MSPLKQHVGHIIDYVKRPYLTEDWVPVDLEAVAAFCCGLFLQQHTTMIIMMINNSATPQATPMIIDNMLLSLSSPEIGSWLGLDVVDFVLSLGVVVVVMVVVVMVVVVVVVGLVVIGLVVIGLVVVVVVGGTIVVVVVVVVASPCKKTL